MTRFLSASPWLNRAAIAFLVACGSAPLSALTTQAQFIELEFDYVITTPDIATDVHGTSASDRQPVREQPGQSFAVPVNLGPLPSGVAIDAHDRVDGTREIFSVEQTTTLPGGITVEPSDIIEWNGSTYSIVFDASSLGLSTGTNVDAVSTGRGSQLHLSFDTSTTVGSVNAEDEDVVLWDGTNGFSMFFDGSTRGVGSEFDVDGCDYLEADEGDFLVVSFDGAGEVPSDPLNAGFGTIYFDEDDILYFDIHGVFWYYAHEPGYANRAANAQTVSAPEPGFSAMLAGGILMLAAISRRYGRPRRGA